MSADQTEESRAKTRERVRRFREKKRLGNAPRISQSAVRLALERPIERIHYPIQPPTIMRGVVPNGEKPLVAMDEAAYESARLAMDTASQFGSQFYAYSNIEGFPGYPYLMLLALRSEYRNMATAMATEMTRKWIKFNSTDTDDEGTKKKITEIEQAFTALNIQGIIRKTFEHDALYGTGQILINIKGADLKTPLIIDPRTIKKDSLQGFSNVDPVWTTPLMYNSVTPSSPNFYKPDSWWVMGEHWDASRIIITITREVPDIYKPAFNFSGISLSQLAEPYVNNWLRTRQSVSDLINNFSIVVLKTAMDQVLTGGDDGSDLFARIKLFTATRSNKGVMALDKDREELEQIAVPLGGLHELQAQALEQLCVVSREPATVLTGVTPSGFGNTAEGEIRIWYDWIHAQQEAYARPSIDKMFKIMQMSLYGELDPHITFDFVPLYEMTEEQMSTIRTNDSVRAGNLIDRGVIDAQEERERLARDPESGYQGIDIEREIAPPDEAEESANLGRATDSALGYDADFVENEHPRAPDGRFGDKPGQHSIKESKGKSDHLVGYGSKQQWPEHIKALKLPPAWTDVRVSNDPQSDLLAIGKDAKGRPQYVYSQKFKDSQSAKKFARIQALKRDRSLIESQLQEKERSSNANERDHADCARLILEMGVRPGSDTDTKAKEKGYGATTLEGRHVVVEDGETRLVFIGKDGVHLDLPVTDKRLAANLANRAKEAGETGRLFGKVRDNTLLDFVHHLDHGGYKTKDFRTYLANEIAANEVESLPVPKTEKDYKRLVREVAVRVSHKLGNTPTVALQSYINPVVFGEWRNAYAA